MDISTVVNVAIAIVIATVTILSSWFVAKRYGDLAGAAAARKYEEEKAAKARIVALQALVNEVLRIQDSACHNSRLVPRAEAQNAIRLPVVALETGFLSENPILSAEYDKNKELLDSVRTYLTAAYFVNAQIDFFLSLSAGMGHSGTTSTPMVNATTSIKDASYRLDATLGRMEELLRRRLEEERQQMQLGSCQG